MEPTAVSAAGYLSDGGAGPDRGGGESTAQSVGECGGLLGWCLATAGALLAACELDGCCVQVAAGWSLEGPQCKHSCLWCTGRMSLMSSPMAKPPP
eukprot:5169528-Amphidinium_carterae.1